MDRKGITLAGNLVMDIGYMIDQYPEKEKLTHIYDPTYHTGGVNNLLIDLVNLDSSIPIKVSGLVGEDENGQRILDTLRQYSNVDSSNIIQEGRTALTYAMTEIVGKKRTFFSDAGSSTAYDIKHIDFDKLDAEIFHLEYLLFLGKLDEEDPIYGTKSARVLFEAQRRGMKTSIDLVSESDKSKYSRMVWPALRYTDYCIINEAEASGVVGEDIYDKNGVIEEKVWPALEKLKQLGVREWAVIHSPKCGYGLNCKTGEKIAVPSLHLPEGFVKGTTGAGDAFCCGVLYSAYNGLGLEAGLKLGAKTAACSLSAEDSNSGIVKYEDIDKALANIE